MDSILTKYSRRFLISFIASILAMQGTERGDAAIMVSIPNVTVAPGGSGHMNVLITGDVADSFQYFFLNFTITGAAQAADPINFVPSVFDFGVTPAPQLSETNPDYVFLGDSAEFDFPIGVDIVADPPGGPSAFDLITVTDETLSGLDRNINDTFLLARLNFVAPLSATPGNVYYVSLDDSTSFVENATLIPSAFSPTSGSITISSAAVPEPGTFAALAILGLLGGFTKHRLRNRGPIAGEVEAS